MGWINDNGTWITWIIIVGTAIMSAWLYHMFAVRREKLEAGKVVLKDVRSIKTDVGKLKEDISGIQKVLNWLYNKFFYTPEPIERRQSPPQLTDFGQTLAKDTKITAHIKGRINRYKKEASGKLGYEVMEFSEKKAKEVFAATGEHEKKNEERTIQAGLPPRVGGQALHTEVT